MDEEILERKKAIIELEREQREVQRDIKSLMKFEPASRILTEDPALADRVNQQRIGHPTQERPISNERKPEQP